MRIRIFIDPKTLELDYFIRCDPGPIPPIIPPLAPDCPKDTEPPPPGPTEPNKERAN